LRAASTLYLSNNNNNNKYFEESMFSKPQKTKFLNNSTDSLFSFTNVCSLGEKKGLNLGKKIKKSKIEKLYKLLVWKLPMYYYYYRVASNAVWLFVSE